MSRSSSAILGILVLAAGGWVGYQRYESRRLSPFKMWDNRAGASFFFFDSEANHDMGKRFRCREIEGDVRLCEVETGVAGLMRLAIDNTGHAMIVQWRVADSSLRMVEEARKMAAEWSLVQPNHTQVKGANGTSRTHWITPDSAWSAWMSDDFSNVANPRSIELVDERRLKKTSDANTRALLRMAQTGYVDASQLDAAMARDPEAVASAARALGESGRTLAIAAARLPHCEFQPGDSVVAGDELRAAYGSADATALQQAVALAYPGMQLVIGAHAYLKDAGGAAEEVRILPPTTDGTSFAFAVSYPRRVALVDVRLQMFSDESNGCRAPAEIVIARRDTATGRIVDAQHLDADEDALASEVTALDFARDVDASTILVAKYDARYGTQRWFGEVDWDALVVPIAGAPKIKRRVPNVLGWKDGDQRETAGIAVVDRTTAAGMHLSLIYTTVTPPTRLILAPGPKGLPSGWMLLDQLQ